jgi:hypothetical protein
MKKYNIRDGIQTPKQTNKTFNKKLPKVEPVEHGDVLPAVKATFKSRLYRVLARRTHGQQASKLVGGPLAQDR